jgi:hypothetical protein
MSRRNAVAAIAPLLVVGGTSIIAEHRKSGWTARPPALLP